MMLTFEQSIRLEALDRSLSSFDTGTSTRDIMKRAKQFERWIAEGREWVEGEDTE